MVRWEITIVVFVATLALFGGVSAASGNEPPLADAGLDQTVDNGTTVYLDAGGSVDPDGTIASVRWTITDPDGRPVSSSDDTNTRTHFTPDRTGKYTANVSITDDDGATRNDALYVTVESPDGPSVTLLGPSETTQNEPTEFTVSTSAGDAELRKLHWLENGSNERTFGLSGDESDVTLNRSFSEAGSYQIDATVLDTRGYSRSSSLLVQVGPASDNSGGNSGGSSGGGDFDHCPDGGSPYFVDGEFIGCNDGGADMIYGDHVLEANGESGLSLYSQDTGEVEQMATEEQVEELQKDPSVPLTRDVVDENYEGNLKTEEEDSFINSGSHYRGASQSTDGQNSPNSGSSGQTDTSSTPNPPIDSFPPFR